MIRTIADARWMLAASLLVGAVAAGAGEEAELPALIPAQCKVGEPTFTATEQTADDGTVRWRVVAKVVVTDLPLDEAAAIGLKPKPAKEPPHEPDWPTQYMVIRHLLVPEDAYRNDALMAVLRERLHELILKRLRTLFTKGGYHLLMEEESVASPPGHEDAEKHPQE